MDGVFIHYLFGPVHYDILNYAVLFAAVWALMQSLSVAVAFVFGANVSQMPYQWHIMLSTGKTDAPWDESNTRPGKNVLGKLYKKRIDIVVTVWQSEDAGRQNRVMALHRFSQKRGEIR